MRNERGRDDFRVGQELIGSSRFGFFLAAPGHGGVGVLLDRISGQPFGNQLGGTSGEDRAWGAAAGALVGGVAGRMWGRQSDMQNQVNYLQQQQFMTTVWITNSNGSKTPVMLRQTEGGQYIGPRGEYYEKMPTEAQLKQVYGM